MSSVTNYHLLIVPVLCRPSSKSSSSKRNSLFLGWGGDGNCFPLLLLQQQQKNHHLPPPPWPLVTLKANEGVVVIREREVHWTPHTLDNYTTVKNGWNTISAGSFTLYFFLHNTYLSCRNCLLRFLPEREKTMDTNTFALPPPPPPLLLMILISALSSVFSANSNNKKELKVE